MNNIKENILIIEKKSKTSKSKKSWNNTNKYVLWKQEENDLISELLMLSPYSKGLMSRIWTGGKARSDVRRRNTNYFWNDAGNSYGSGHLGTQIGKNINHSSYLDAK